MKCTFCSSAKKTNNFVSGSTNYQKSVLDRHIASQDHKEAETASVLRIRLEKSVAASNEEFDRQVCRDKKSHEAQIRTVYMMSKELIPAAMFNDIVDLQPFTRFVQIGRVVFIAHGKYTGKLCVIVDVIDQNRALVDGPCSGIPRQSLNFKSMHLTKFVIKIQHSCRTRSVRKAWEDAKISSLWSETSWAKKLVDRKKRTQMTDFDRFSLMKSRQSRNRIIRREYNRLYHQANRDPPKVHKHRRVFIKAAKAKRAGKGGAKKEVKK